MKKQVIFFVILLFTSCGNIKTTTFSTMTYKSKGIEEKFIIDIPNDYIKSYSLERESIIKKWVYKNDVYMYISSDITFKDSPNVENWIKCSNVEKGIKCIEGKQDNGKYWKEIEKENLIIGYINVPENRKEEFDKAILSLKRR